MFVSRMHNYIYVHIINGFGFINGNLILQMLGGAHFHKVGKVIDNYKLPLNLASKESQQDSFGRFPRSGTDSPVNNF